MLASSFWHAILEVAFVTCSSMSCELTHAMSLLILELPLVDVALLSRKLALCCALALLKVCLEAGAIGEDHFTGAVLDTPLVFTYELRSIWVGLGAIAVRSALEPGTVIDDATCFGYFSLTMLPSL